MKNFDHSRVWIVIHKKYKQKITEISQKAINFKQSCEMLFIKAHGEALCRALFSFASSVRIIYDNSQTDMEVLENNSV